MRFLPAEPDIATIFNRIADGDIDLQPDFQRGEVWPIPKRQRLVDSILRGWVVPPILLVSSEHSHAQQVLDGQQRLVSIRDFKLGKFPVDGSIEPVDDQIQRLDGFYFSDLPSEVAKRFDRTTLRLYELTDYNPDEPAEIFFRLNQTTPLTSAEKRNAFFGPVRDQVRALVDDFSGTRAAQLLGFTNSRMAYDDVFSRLACTLELGSLQKKVTASTVTNMYRRSEPLEDTVFRRVRLGIESLNAAILDSHGYSNLFPPVRLNKATFFSWLLFVVRLKLERNELRRVGAFLHAFEASRHHEPVPNLADPQSGNWLLPARISPLLAIYSDRATARVADVSSILLRDFCLWAGWYSVHPAWIESCTDESYARVGDFVASLSDLHAKALEEETLRFMESVHWGARI